MKMNKIIYWTSTVLLVITAGLFSIADIFATADLKEMTRHLGFPVYILPYWGTLKILATVCIVVPALKRYREIAYAGIFFFFAGAVYAHLANGDGFGKAALPLSILAIAVTSYIFSKKVHK